MAPSPFLIPAALFMGFFNFWSDLTQTLPIYQIQVVNEFPHDPQAFTQGLLYTKNGTLYESTGLYGHSSVRRVALETGEANTISLPALLKVEAIHRMDHKYFGEGLTLFGEKLLQVTWLTTTGFIYDESTLSKTGKFTNPMLDGWGLATDGKTIFGSDGSSTLYHIDPHTYEVTEKYVVKYNGKEVYLLNELEYVSGEVWANVLATDCIARISSKDGRMLGWIYLPSLRKELIASGHKGIGVLNGIAWDEKENRFFVTGKLWPKLFEIKVNPMKKSFAGDVEKLCVPPVPPYHRTS